MTGNPSAETAANLHAARLILDRLGVNVDQLLEPVAAPRQMPRFDEYTARVSKAVTPGTLRVYESYWNRVREVWGSRRLDEPTALELQQLVEQTRAHVVVRRNARGGRSAAEHLVASLRCLYRFAVAALPRVCRESGAGEWHLDVLRTALTGEAHPLALRPAN